MNSLAPEIQSVDADISHGTEMLMDPDIHTLPYHKREQGHKEAWCLYNFIALSLTAWKQ